jgi:hypothetical protein
VEHAWRYAYLFFFDFPRPFPWHLVRMWEDYKLRPLQSVLAGDESVQWEETFKYLVGEPIDWTKVE